jgi:hypothetical protein
VRRARAAPNTCASDQDCACYPGGLGAQPSCGGVTDKKTAAALISLYADFNHRCRMTTACAATVCTPRCDHGACR